MIKKEDLESFLQSFIPLIAGELTKVDPEPPRHEHAMTRHPIDGSVFQAPPGAGWIHCSVDTVSSEQGVFAVVLWRRDVYSTPGRLPEDVFGGSPPVAPSGPVRIEPIG